MRCYSKRHFSITQGGITVQCNINVTRHCRHFLYNATLMAGAINVRDLNACDFPPLRRLQQQAEHPFIML